MNKNSYGKTILIYDSVKYFVPYFFEKGLPAYPLFRELPLFVRLLRKLYFIFGLPKNTWYAGWKNELHNAEKIIIFSTQYNDVLNYIKLVAPHVRVIYWYWNPAFRSADPNSLPDKLCEKWSFDKNDCERYKMRYNTTFYFDNIKLPVNKSEFDVVFLGADKGRRAALNSINNELSVIGIKPYFYIVDDNAGKRGYEGQFPAVDYGRYLEMISKSAAILDYIQEGQTGLTLRPMEALFFKKKLITNDQSITQFDFYNSDNIFIIGVDDMKNLRRFLKTPYQPVASEILSRYDVGNWINRFDGQLNQNEPLS